MKKKQEKMQEPKPDPHLDIPSEANRDKHINFRKLEEEDEQLISFKNKDEVDQRRKQWQKGIEEGEEERRKDVGNDQ
jgi:hypothetical protein